MRVVGILVWYDERPSMLSACVSGFARICDEIVACDGAYRLYPGARARSHPDQSDAIVAAAEAAGCGLTLYRPSEPFAGNEIAKRNHTLRLASTLEPDWVMVFDADFHVSRCDDPAFVRQLLERTDKNVATYMVRDGDGETEWAFPVRAVYRWTDDLRYGPAHYCVRGTYDGEERWLRAHGILESREEDVEPLGSSLVVTHRKSTRADARADAAAKYAKVRDSVGAEDISGLVAAA